MEFCIISPIAHLERYATLSRTHLVLAQYLYNDKYFSFYDERRRAGDTLILDNGAYENTRPCDIGQYLNWIKNLQPHVVVLPDILRRNWLRTTSASLRFLDACAHGFNRGYSPEWMFVPQCENTGDEFYSGVPKVLLDGRVGHHVTWIGLGRYLNELPYHGTHYNHRVQKAMWMQDNYPHIKVHALGMAAGDTAELKPLAEAGVRSIDSSAPVWRGLSGYSLKGNDRIKWQTEGTPCNFHSTESYHGNELLIAANLEACNVNTTV